jgi:DNA repair protein SbcC/Rad50
MIPLQLSLKNFLSYSETNLDFVGLHTACICGPNGAGKSSLLEAITWAIWGECRAASEDDAISNGASDVRVDFTFKLHGETCRIIRARQRGGAGMLEFQIKTTEEQFRSLTQKGTKATQALIDRYLKIDYETFINSAYLRQGKADEFMLKKPADRKQILADLLKLDRYEELADRAKEVNKQFKQKVESTEQNLASYLAQLDKIGAIESQRAEVNLAIASLQELQTADEQELESYRTTARQRDTWHQQLEWEQKRATQLLTESKVIQQDLERARSERDRWQNLIDRSEEINTAYHQYQTLQTQVEVWEHKAQAHQQLLSQQQQYQQELAIARQQIELDRTKSQTELGSLDEQERETQEIIAREPKITEDLTTLDRHRQHLEKLDRLQQQISPLEKRRTDLQVNIERETAKVRARLDELIGSIAQEQNKIDRQARLEVELGELDLKITELDNQKVYLDRLKDKGIDLNNALNKIDLQIESSRQQIAEIERKIELLNAPDAECPLCHSPLDAQHWQEIHAAAKTESEELEERISALKQTKAETESDRDRKRVEYQQLSKEIKVVETLREQRAKIQAQLDSIAENQQQLDRLSQEKLQLEISLQERTYAASLQTELDRLNTEIKTLEYDDKTHALVRSEVTKWQRAEIDRAKLKDAKNRQKTLAERRSLLTNRVAELDLTLITLNTQSPLQAKLTEITEQLTEINYDRHQHQQMSIELRQSQSSLLQHQELQQAQKAHPEISERIILLETSDRAKLEDRNLAQLEIDRIGTEIAKIPDTSEKIQTLDRQLATRRQELDTQITTRGRLEEQLCQLATMQTELEKQREQLLTYKQQQRIYDELSKAFGKNGIQALIIENILPQLEAETNRILTRLTNSQFHVRFITQKATKSSTKSKRASIKSAKYIDTLDIEIGDQTGTRPYETYSGGESFRINFSIRLALAKLLSQRAGTPLQMLIVDEGFGTQDREGCERLISAIQAIASDFACILTVTHMPQFREAFQTRIEVKKTANGSQVQLVS